MPEFSIQQCPVCKSSKFSHFLTCTDFYVTGYQFSLKKCNSCSFIITENVEDEANIKKYYQSENYIAHSNTSKGFVNFLYHQVRKFMLVQKRKHVEKASGIKYGKLLDVGTGTGYFLKEMQRYGWSVNGTEKSSEARDFAEKAFNIEIHETEQLFQTNENSFDVVTLWHALEHIHRLDENMKAFKKVLKPKGKLIIAVPNPTSYDARHYHEFWAAYDVPRHIWHFGPDQMKQFGEKYGFKLIRSAPMPFDSFYVSILSEKYKNSRFAFIKGIFHGKISWFKSLVNKNRCSSVIYAFEKN